MRQQYNHLGWMVCLLYHHEVWGVRVRFPWNLVRIQSLFDMRFKDTMRPNHKAYGSHDTSISMPIIVCQRGQPAVLPKRPGGQA